MNFLLGNERIKQISKIELGNHLDSLHSHLHLFIYLSIHSSFKCKITCGVCVCVCVCVCARACACVYAQLLSHIQLFTTSWTITHQAPLSMELSRQEYWGDLTFPPPGHLPGPGFELASPPSSAYAGKHTVYPCALWAVLICHGASLMSMSWKGSMLPPGCLTTGRSIMWFMFSNVNMPCRILDFSSFWCSRTFPDSFSCKLCFCPNDHCYISIIKSYIGIFNC